MKTQAFLFTILKSYRDLFFWILELFFLFRRAYILLKKNALFFLRFFFGKIKQKPMPQLNVLIFLDQLYFFLLLIHLKMLFILIFDKSISIEYLSGTDRNKFSINPPPVICAEALINFLSTNFKISLE